MPDNREIATTILLLGFVVFGLTVRGARERIPDLLRSAARLAWLLVLYLVSAALVLWGAWSIGLWSADFWWSTAIVVLVLGFSLVASAVGARSLKALWESIARKTVGAAIFIGLYANLATFSLTAELLLQVLAALAGTLRAMAQGHDQKPVRRLSDAMLSIIGLALIVRTTTILSQGMPGIEWIMLLKQVLLSVWFPFALVPLLHLVSYFSAVEKAAIGVRVVPPREASKWPIIVRFLPAFRLRLSLAAAFDREWGRRYAIEPSWRERRRVLSQFRSVERPRFTIRRRGSALAWFKRAIGRSERTDDWDGCAMPRSPRELEQMLDRRPPGWEFMAFGSNLWIGMAGRRSEYLRHWRRRPPQTGKERIDSNASLSRLTDELRHAARLGESIVDILDGKRLERAFGLPGELGRADEIQRMADDVVDLYVALMDWCGRLRGTRVPVPHRRAYRAAARLMDGPIEQLRRFAASLAMQLDQVPGHVTNSASHPLNIVLTVALSVRPEDQARFDRACTHIGQTTAGAASMPQAAGEGVTTHVSAS